MLAAFRGQRIVITGATGLVGKRLSHELAEGGAQVVSAVRRPVKDESRELYWNPETGEIDRAKLEDVDAIVHLAGENIAGGRWTEAFKEKILESRVTGTHLISDAIARLQSKPRIFLCASAIGYYGDRGAELMSEQSAPANDFLGRVCQKWEAACQSARDANVPVINTRIGVILSPDGGALKKMLLPFKLGAGGKIGSGEQYMSWIALDDVVGAMAFLLEQSSTSGPVNLVAPHPVTNAAYAKTLGRVLSRPTIFPMPPFAARLAFGEMADALLLSSTRVVPQALLDAGYRFRYPELEVALRHLLRRR